MKLLLDFTVALDELVGVLLDFSSVLLELLVDLVVHGDLPHFGLWVKLKVVLELIVKGLELLSNLLESSDKLWSNLIVEVHNESLVSHVHLSEFHGDIVLHVLEFALDLWLLKEVLEVHHDGLLFLIGVHLESVPSGLDLLELHSVFWGVKLHDALLKSLGNLHLVDFLIVLILLELESEFIKWLIKLLNVLPDFGLSFLDFIVDLWVHGNFPHLETLVVPVEVSLEFFVEGLPFLANGFELSLVFLLTKKTTGLLKSLTNLLEFSLDFGGELLKFLADLWVRMDELVDILFNHLVIMDDLLEFLVVHGNLPHFETFGVPSEGLLDLKVESLHLLADFLELLLIFWVFEHLAGLFKSDNEFVNLLVEDLNELLGFGLDLWVRVVELLHVFTEGLVLSDDLLVLIVVHGGGPHRLGLWGDDLAGGADGTSDEHHDGEFHV